MIRLWGDFAALIASFVLWGAAQVQMDTKGPSRILRLVTALCALGMGLATADALLQVP